jgi:hypothetical protein
MRLVVGLLFLLSFASAAAADPKLAWEAKGLAQPESVVQDPATGAFYVSNINGAVMQKDGNGFITKLRPDGTTAEREWVKGLNAPAGLGIHDRTLYVADVDQLVEVNAASGSIVKRHEAKGSVFLNDVEVDGVGTVYVSDTPTNTIWRLKDGKLEPWLASDELNGPNGLLIEGDKLIIASLGKVPSEGQKKEFAGLLSVSLKDQKISKIGNGKPIGNLDGIEPLKPGTYLVSDWGEGALFQIDAKGNVKRLIDLHQGSADLTILPDKTMVLIPMMLDNSLAAYKLN